MQVQVGEHIKSFSNPALKLLLSGFDGIAIVKAETEVARALFNQANETYTQAHDPTEQMSGAQIKEAAKTRNPDFTLFDILGASLLTRKNALGCQMIDAGQAFLAQGPGGGRLRIYVEAQCKLLFIFEMYVECKAMKQDAMNEVQAALKDEGDLEAVIREYQILDLLE